MTDTAELQARALTLFASRLQQLQATQCDISRKTLDIAFGTEGLTPDQFQSIIGVVLKHHILASTHELEILQREFREKEFNGHHVKCPGCWDYYMHKKRIHCGG